jgi:hypothetical protein
MAAASPAAGRGSAGDARHRLDVAERILKPHLLDDPFDVRAIRILAELAARIGRLRDSETLLRRALEAGWKTSFGPLRWNGAVFHQG